MSDLLDQLFEHTEANERIRSEEEYPNFPRHVSVVRCACGSLVNVGIPTRCQCCQSSKGYWSMIDGRVIRISEMRLDHLTNCIKMLSTKSESVPPDLRGRYEIALDIMYLELGSRDKEIAQAAGILSALRKGLDAK